MIGGAAHLGGLILAGGEGRRMGYADKAFIALDGASLIEIALGRLGPQVSNHIVISTNGDPARFSDLGYPVLIDERPHELGPIGGVLRGLEWARGNGLSGVITVAVDTPFFPLDLVSRLSAAGGAAFATTKTGSHPTFAFWPAESFERVAKATAAGERKMTALLDMVGAVAVDFSESGRDAFFNINTPDDLEHARAITRSRA